MSILPDSTLPVTPASPSLASHLQALSLLSAHLSTLPTQSRWPARIPLNSKASVRADIIHTDEVKINVGGEWWVSMTADEAGAWVERRRRALLEEHARAKEGRGRASFSLVADTGEAEMEGAEQIEAARKGAEQVDLREVRFNPIFRAPPGMSSHSGPSHSTGMPSAGPSAAAIRTSESQQQQQQQQKLPSQPRRADQLIFPNAPEEQQPVVASGETMQDLVTDFIDTHLGQAGSSKGSKQVNERELVNEQGLPIRDIREDEEGVSLDADPTGALDIQTLEPEVLVDERVEKADYWSADAEARRAALRRKILEGGSSNSDSDSVIESDEDDGAAASGSGGQSGAAAASARPPTPPILSSSRGALPDSPDQPFSPAPLDGGQTPPVLRRRSSASAPPPGRGILKSASRKKSVSFDPTLPDMPDSPGSPAVGNSGAATGKLGFSLPGEMGMNAVKLGKEADRAEGEKQVPIISAPRPPARAATPSATPVASAGSASGFAGFKPGFLTAASTSTAADRVVSKEEGSSQSTLSSTGPAAAKRPSRFAQQRSVESAATAAGPSKRTGLEDTSSMRAAVVEKVFERPVMGTSNAQMKSTPATGHDEHSEDDEVQQDEEDDEEEDDDYDFDDRLLAREIALEQHRRQAYRSQHFRDADEEEALRQMTSEHDSGQNDGSASEAEEGERGGVMLGLPSISTLDASGQPTIINPTPDSIRQFVRVGRLDNGNLVLAPGEEGWSDSDEAAEHGAEDEAALVRRRNRREMKRRLMAGDFRDVVTEPHGERNEDRREKEAGLPPSLMPVQSAASNRAEPVASIVTERQPARSTKGVEPEVQGVKSKVSRFKAQRNAA